MGLSLRLRLMLWYGALLALSLLSFGSLLYIVLRANLERQVDDALRLRAAQIGRSLPPGRAGLLAAADLAPGPLGPGTVEEAGGQDLPAELLGHPPGLGGSR